MPEGSGDGILRGLYRLRVDVRQDGADRRCSCSVRARSCARSIAAAELLRDDFGVERGRVERDQRSRCCARDGLDVRALEPAASRRRAAPSRTSRRRSTATPARSSPPATTSRRSSSRSVRSSTARCTRSGPTVTAAAIRARSCAHSSKSTGATSRWPRCTSWRRRAASNASASPRRSRSTRSIPNKPNPVTV